MKSIYINGQKATVQEEMELLDDLANGKNALIQFFFAKNVSYYETI